MASRHIFIPLVYKGSVVVDVATDAGRTIAIYLTNHVMVRKVLQTAGLEKNCSWQHTRLAVDSLWPKRIFSFAPVYKGLLLMLVVPLQYISQTML